MSRDGEGGAVSGWLVAAAVAGLLIFCFMHRNEVMALLNSAGRVVGSSEAAGGSP